MVLFACCRENYIENKFNAVEQEEEEGSYLVGTAARGETKIAEVVPMNFTYVFGCNPADGVKADTKFIQTFVEHLRGLFDPEDGTLMFPECLGVIDSTKGGENFESTSCNIGKSLRLKRYDNRVDHKQLVVIRRNEELIHSAIID